jgi:hypothetical protein
MPAPIPQTVESLPSDRQGATCACCDALASRVVPLVEADMSVSSHDFCDACWTRLLEHLTRQRPWLHVDDDPGALYVAAELAWSLLGRVDNPAALGGGPPNSLRR